VLVLTITYVLQLHETCTILNTFNTCYDSIEHVPVHRKASTYIRKHKTEKKDTREDRQVRLKTWQNDLHILTMADINTRVIQNVMLCSLIDIYLYQSFRRICFLHSQESPSSGPPYTYHEDPFRSAHTATLKKRAAGLSYTLIATYSENGTWWHTRRNQIRSSSETDESIYISGGVSSVEYWMDYVPSQAEDCWLPTPFASFPFTSPPVRRRVPPDSVSTLPFTEAL